MLKIGEIIASLQQSENDPLSLDEFRRKLNSSEREKEEKMSDTDLLAEALSMILSKIKTDIGYSLRNTQIITILAALLSPHNNLLSQVQTGEGKSCIVLSVAVIRGLFGMKTDVVTSSSVLAQRDAQEYKGIYDLFQLSVGEVTMTSAKERKRAYLNMVVYGELSNFQRDHLLDKFYNENNRGNRSFDYIIIDEVDSMFLDKGNSVLYLSHTPPDLDTLDGIFSFIWNGVVHQTNEDYIDPQELYLTTMDQIFPRLEPSLLEKITDDWEQLRDWLVEGGFLWESGRFKSLGGGVECKLEGSFETLQDVFEVLINKILLQPQSRKLRVSKHLEEFVDLHLATWVKNAYQATRMMDGVEYVIDYDRNSGEDEKEAKVIILDTDTGVDLKESQWTGGLHQFLQLKHGCKLTPLSLKAVFISNISFFNLYENLFGLTGTLGTDVDRRFLEKTYKCNFIVVPTAIPRNFTEELPKSCHTKREWIDAIDEDVKVILQQERSVLIICETVRDVEYVFKELSAGGVSTDQLRMYRRDFEPFYFTIGDNRLDTQNVIITTNLAGRGTDIKLSKQLIEKGGLHVIFSYLPTNTRVWWQGFGRASRCGDPGSGRLIFKTGDDRPLLDLDLGKLPKEQNPNSAEKTINYLVQNDEIEMERVGDIYDYYNNVIKKEEEAFTQFQNILKKIRVQHSIPSGKMISTTSEKIVEFLRQSKGDMKGILKDDKELLKESIMNDWAFWLDQYSETLSRSFQDDVEGECEMNGAAELENAFGKYNLKEGETIGFEVMTKTINEPASLIKLGLFYVIKENRFDLGSRCFEKVISNEANFSSSIAKYYKIYCRLNDPSELNKSSKKLSRSVIKEIKSLIKEFREWQTHQLAIAAEVCENKMVEIDCENVYISNALRNQKKSVVEILEMFIQSLESLLPKRVSKWNFVTTCKTNFASTFTFEQLIEKRILKLSEELSTEEKCEALNILRKSYPLSDDGIRLCRTATGESNSLKPLMKVLNLPSTQGFWKELNLNSEDICVFGVIKIPCIEPNKNIKVLVDYFDRTKSETGIYICKRNTAMSNCNEHKLICGTRDELRQNPEFNYYKNQNLAYIEEVTKINLVSAEKVKLKSHQALTKDDFSRVIEGIHPGDSLKIFESLITSGKINTSGELLETDLTDWVTSLPKPFQIFGDDFVKLIIGKCSYKYQLLSLLNSLRTLNSDVATNSSNIIHQHFATIAIPQRLFEEFLSEAYELGLIPGYVIHEEEVRSLSARGSVGSPPQNLTLRKDTFEELFSNKDIVKYPPKPEQIERYWKDIKMASQLQMGPHKYDIKCDKKFSQITLKRNVAERTSKIRQEPELSSNAKVISTTQQINEVRHEQKNGMDDSEENPNFAQDDPGKDDDEPTSLEYLSDLVFFAVQKSYLQDMCESLLTGLSSSLALQESPQVYLEEISSQVGQATTISKYTATTLSSFYLSGLSFIICVHNEKYSRKMLISTTTILLTGIIQVAAAVIVSTNFGLAFFTLGQTLADSGLNDIIFALNSFRTGHFRWREYLMSKGVQIAVSLISPIYPFASCLHLVSKSTTRTVAVGQSLLQQATSLTLTYGIPFACQQSAPFLANKISALLAKVVLYLSSSVRKTIEEHSEFNQALQELSKMGEVEATTSLHQYTNQTFTSELTARQLEYSIVNFSKRLFNEAFKPFIEKYAPFGSHSKQIGLALELLGAGVFTIADSIGIPSLVYSSLDTISSLINSDIQQIQFEEANVVSEPTLELSLKLRHQFTESVVKAYEKAFQENLIGRLMEKSMNKISSTMTDLIPVREDKTKSSRSREGRQAKISPQQLPKSKQVRKSVDWESLKKMSPKGNWDNERARAKRLPGLSCIDEQGLSSRNQRERNSRWVMYVDKLGKSKENNLEKVESKEGLVLIEDDQGQSGFDLQKPVHLPETKSDW